MNQEKIAFMIESLSNMNVKAMLMMDDHGNKKRHQAFNPADTNLVSGQDGLVIMSTGMFGDHVLNLRKLCRDEVWAHDVLWKDAVWFKVFPNKRVPVHKDDDYGDQADRGRDHITICVGGSCVFVLNGVMVSDTCVTFNPKTMPHGAIAGPYGAYILQVPMKL